MAELRGQLNMCTKINKIQRDNKFVNIHGLMELISEESDRVIAEMQKKMMEYADNHKKP